MDADVAAARQAARFRVGSLHVSAQLGPNMATNPDQALRRYKPRLIALGCDLVHGHSAQVFQGVEVGGRSPISYDIGDVLNGLTRVQK